MPVIQLFTRQNTSHPLLIGLSVDIRSRMTGPQGMNAWTDEGSHWPAGCHNTIMKGILERHAICKGRKVQTDLACQRVRSTYVRAMSLSVTRSYLELQTHRIQTWVVLLNCFNILDLIFQSEMEENLGWEHDLLMLCIWSLTNLLWRGCTWEITRVIMTQHGLHRQKFGGRGSFMQGV